MRTFQTLTAKKILTSFSNCRYRTAEVKRIGQSFLTLKEYSKNEIVHLLCTAADLKTRIKEHNESFQPLKGRSLGMIFEESSSRTKTSTEAGMNLLGGQTCHLAPKDIRVDSRDAIQDVGRNTRGLVDCVLARVSSDKDLKKLHTYSNIPVINGSSSMFHPLQVLADFLTLVEHFGNVKGKYICWVGDGNNIIHSLMMCAPKLGLNLRICTPRSHKVSSHVASWIGSSTAIESDAADLAKQFGTTIQYTDCPAEAVYGTNIIITDLWENLPTYPVTQRMCDSAAHDWCFLHCLPWQPKHEHDEWFHSDRCLIHREIENRKWTVMSVLLNLIQGYSVENHSAMLEL